MGFITDLIERYKLLAADRWHTPGHKGLLWADDITEIDGDEFFPADAVVSAQETAAQFYGSRYLRFLTGGSSMGVKAAVLAAGGDVLTATGCHRSVFEAAALAGVKVFTVDGTVGTAGAGATEITGVGGKEITGAGSAKIVGMSRNQQRRRIRSTEFPLDPTGLYTIAVANGEVDPESLAERRIDYWALGGIPRRQVFHGNPRKKGQDGKPISLELPEAKRDKKDLPPLPYTVHYPGATVARTPQDIGLYGATLVEISSDLDPILTYFSTSPIRWVNDQISLEANDDAGKLADELRFRIKNYRDSQKSDDLLINWFVDVPPGQLASNLRRGSLTADLLSELRSVYGKEEPITWSVSLTLLLPEQLPKTYYEQQTILGDFLRSVKHFQDNPNEMIDLESYLPKDWGTEEVVHSLLLTEKIANDAGNTNHGTGNPEEQKSNSLRLFQSPVQQEMQQRILVEAAAVGLELLGNEPSNYPQFYSHKSASDDNLTTENQ
jgi:hypothetical protein